MRQSGLGIASFIVSMKFKNILLIVFVTLLLCGCGKAKKPDTISQRVYGLGCSIIDVTDEYLDGNITTSEAYEKVDELFDEIKLSVDDDYKDDDMVYLYSYSIYTDFFCLDLQQRYNTETTVDINNLSEDRNKLAEILGLSQK